MDSSRSLNGASSSLLVSQAMPPIASLAFSTWAFAFSSAAFAWAAAWEYASFRAARYSSRAFWCASWAEARRSLWPPAVPDVPAGFAPPPPPEVNCPVSAACSWPDESLALRHTSVRLSTAGSMG